MVLDHDLSAGSPQSALRDLRVLVFDLDGTLIDLDVDWDELRRVLGVDPARERLGEAIQRLCRTGDPILAEVTRVELAALGATRVSAGIGAALAQLGSSFKLAVLTRNSRGVAIRALADLGDQVFVVGREDCPVLKPEPDGLYQIMAQYRVPAAQVALIGDTYHDVGAAAAAGVTSIVVRNRRLAFVPGGADHYIDSPTDLPALLDQRK